MSLPQSEVVHLAKLLVGPILIGTVINVWLLGVMCMQCYTYFYTRNQDPRWIRMMVAFLLLADIVNSIFDAACAYHYSVLSFGDVHAIQKSTWLFSTDPVMTTIISSVVQGFFGWRVDKLTHQRWLAICIGISAVIQFLCGLGSSIGSGIVVDFVQFPTKLKSVVTIWLVLAPVTDTAITFSLVWYLQQHRTGFRGTDDIVSRVIRLTVQTGMITAICAILDLALFLAYMGNNFHLILNFTLAKLYTNSLMSSLNARGHWSTSSGGEDNEAPSRSGRGGIQVTTITGIHRDHYELGNIPGLKPNEPFPVLPLDLAATRQNQHGGRGFMPETKRHVQLDDIPSLKSDDALSMDDKISNEEDEEEPVRNLKQPQVALHEKAEIVEFAPR